MYIIDGILFGIIIGLLFCKFYNIPFNFHGMGDIHMDIFPPGYKVLFFTSLIGATIGICLTFLQKENF
jgi:hypothetical protein